MKRRVWAGVGSGLAFLLLMAVVNAQAPAATLSGKVSSSSLPLEGAAVLAEDPVSGATFGPATTDGTGFYQIVLPGGVYDIHVTPPSGSGLGPAVALGRTVSGTTVIDFALFEAGSARFSGHVLDARDAGAAGYTVVLSAPALPTIQTTTAADGAFAFGVQAGDYNAQLEGYWPGPNTPAALPLYFYGWSTNQVSIAGSMTTDIQLPFKQVTVRVQDPGGAPVVDAVLSPGWPTTCGVTVGPWQMCGYSRYWGDSGLRTNADGEVTLWLWPTVAEPSTDQAYTITAKPPDGSGLATTAAGNIAVTADRAVTITLASANTFSGHLLDARDAGAAGYTVVLSAPALPTTQTTTAADGAFAFGVQAGDYNAQLEGYWPGPNTPAALPLYFYGWSTNQVSIAGSMTTDIQLPFKQVTVRVQDPGGAPVVDAVLSPGWPTTCGVTVGPWQMCGYSRYWGDSGLRTNADGEVTLWLWPTVAEPSTDQAYTITAKPPDGSELATTAAGNIAVTADRAVTITLASAATFSGHLLDARDAGAAGYTVVLSAPALPTTQTTTAADGAFAFGVQPGDYNAQLEGYWPGANTPAALPLYFYGWSTNQVSIAGTMTTDIPLPFKKVTVRVQDPRGAPVVDAVLSPGWPTTCGVAVGPWQMCGYSRYWGDSGLRTNADGEVTLWLWPTVPAPTTDQAYTITAKPPDGSPFVTFAEGNIVVTSDKLVVIVLPWVHDPPITELQLAPPAGPGGTYGDPVTVSLSAIAFGGATVAQTTYQLDDGPAETYTTTFDVTGDGTHSVTYWSVDSAGVTEPSRTTTFEIATTIEGLIATTQAACATGGITKPGICVSLQAKLYAAHAANDRGQSETAINNLEAYLHELEAQRGKAVIEQTYALLVARTLVVIAGLR